MRRARPNRDPFATVPTAPTGAFGVQVIDPYGKSTYVRGITIDEAFKVIGDKSLKPATLLLLWAEVPWSEGIPRKLVARYAVVRPKPGEPVVVVKGKPRRAS